MTVGQPYTEADVQLVAQAANDCRDDTPADVARRVLAALAQAERLMPARLLTEAEHRAMALTAELWNLLCTDIVGQGRSRSGDVRELGDHIHAIQNVVMAQAAARAYPNQYRLLGGEL